MVANTNRHPVTDGGKPISMGESGWVNKYRMFNKNIGNTCRFGTFTSNPESIDLTIRPGQRVNAIGLVGVRASSIRVVMTVPGVTGPVYDKTFSCRANLAELVSVFTSDRSIRKTTLRNSICRLSTMPISA